MQDTFLRVQRDGEVSQETVTEKAVDSRAYGMDYCGDILDLGSSNANRSQLDDRTRGARSNYLHGHGFGAGSRRNTEVDRQFGRDHTGAGSGIHHEIDRAGIV
jgi:hypothetical protein